MYTMRYRAARDTKNHTLYLETQEAGGFNKLYLPKGQDQELVAVLMTKAEFEMFQAKAIVELAQ